MDQNAKTSFQKFQALAKGLLAVKPEELAKAKAQAKETKKRSPKRNPSSGV